MAQMVFWSSFLLTAVALIKSMITLPRFVAALFLLVPWLVIVASARPVYAEELKLPELGAADYYWIASRIFDNETRGQTRFLTYWGAGEDFPSLGIGHFIWFPKGVDAPFDESFPTMVRYVRERSNYCSPLPDWMQHLKPFDAPWNSKEAFDGLQQTERMIELREWLVATAPEQAQYIVASFTERWNRLELPDGNKERLTQLLQRLLQSSRGMYAVIDYSNFKGLGSNPRERYKGKGWGLVQVLGDMEASGSYGNEDLISRFSKAAGNRLTMRVSNSPPERNEIRWLEGWLKRTTAYTKSAPALVGQPQSAFRVKPYLPGPSIQVPSLKDPARTTMNLVWFSSSKAPGRVRIRKRTGSEKDNREMVSTPGKACELAYHLAEYRDLGSAQSVPYKHLVTLENLNPGEQYYYEVNQDGDIATGEFRAPVLPGQAVKFIVYGDSETEPESRGKHTLWPEFQAGKESRHYPVDQTTGYAANLEVIYARRPDFVAIAGDLVESGGEQRDWDEFWRHNEKMAVTIPAVTIPAVSIPIVPAPGNHDYYGGPGELGGYSNNATRRAINKYRAYFDAAPYYALDYGPVRLVVLDSNNGVPERSASDTNWFLSGEDAGGIAPALDPSSSQMKWLKRTLLSAQKEKQFTFVMFHSAPYTSGIHGKPPGVESANNFSSGIPLRALTPIFLQYGVDAVFNGHDEMYEHSVIHGKEQYVDGRQSDHSVHFFTLGIGGDGLRGPDPAVENPQRVFLAHVNAPEVYGPDGLLKDGGKHYGHLEVSVTENGSGLWQALFEPVYVFPVLNKAGKVDSFERRVYDDVLLLEKNRDN